MFSLFFRSARLMVLAVVALGAVALGNVPMGVDILDPENDNGKAKLPAVRTLSTTGVLLLCVLLLAATGRHTLY